MFGADEIKSNNEKLNIWNTSPAGRIKSNPRIITGISRLLDEARFESISLEKASYVKGVAVIKFDLVGRLVF